MECSAPSARACQGLSIHTRFIVSQWQPPSSAAAHLVHPGRQQLHDGEVLAGALHDVPRGPVVEGAPHRHAAAAVAPCARGRLRWRSDARAPRSFARARLHAAAGCAQARQAAQDRRLRSGGRLQARRLVAQERRDRVPQAAGRAREPRLPTRGPRGAAGERAGRTYDDRRHELGLRGPAGQAMELRRMVAPQRRLVHLGDGLHGDLRAVRERRAGAARRRRGRKGVLAGRAAVSRRAALGARVALRPPPGRRSVHECSSTHASRAAYKLRSYCAAPGSLRIPSHRQCHRHGRLA